MEATTVSRGKASFTSWVRCRILPGMSETTTQADRDSHGRFQTGSKGGPGRVKGSRNKLGEEFLAKFAADVEKFGTSVIERVRTERPEVYLKVWADLLPRKTELDVNVDLTALHDVGSALQAFNQLTEMLGAAPQVSARRLRRLTVINNDPDL